MKKIKSYAVIIMSLIMFLNMNASAEAACSEWHTGGIVRSYCSTPICNYAAGGVPYKYEERQIYRYCVADNTGESYTEYTIRVENPGCC